MKKVSLIACAIALVALGWSVRSLVGFRGGGSVRAQPKVPCVRVAVAEEREFNPAVEYVGHVEPIEATDILPQIDGYVKKVCFAEGAEVRAGELLFEIDDEQYVAAMNLRRSDVRNAEAKLVVARAEVDRAERYFGRLSAVDDRGITATERDTAETTLNSARATLAAAKAAIEQAKASEAMADFNLRHTKVRSPISGRIGKALHHVGDYVSPSKTPLARVVRTDPVRVAFPIADSECARWREGIAKRGGTGGGRLLRLRLPDGTLYDRTGTFAFCDNEMNRGTGTLVMYADFSNAGGRLVPNAYVRIVSCNRVAPRELVVPESAVELQGGSHRVWRLEQSGVVTPVSVEIGPSDGGVTVVKRGLSAGDRVVSAGTFKLSPEMAVEVVP